MSGAPPVQTEQQVQEDAMAFWAVRCLQDYLEI